MGVPYYIDVLVFTFDIDKIITGTISFPRLIFEHNSCIHGFKKIKMLLFNSISKNQDSKFQLWSATVKVSKKVSNVKIYQQTFAKLNDWEVFCPLQIM